MPGKARSPAAQSPNVPTPGSTMRSAWSRAAALAVTVTLPGALDSIPARSKAFAADRRFPDP